MFCDEFQLEPDDDNKIRLFGDRFLELFPDGFEFYIRTASSYLFHCEGGPATYSNNSGWVEEGYRVHGNLQRMDGPAVIKYDDGTLFNFRPNMTKAQRISEYMKHADSCYYQWWWQGRKLAFKDWLKLTDLSDKDRAWLVLKYV